MNFSTENKKQLHVRTTYITKSGCKKICYNKRYNDGKTFYYSDTPTFDTTLGGKRELSSPLLLPIKMRGSFFLLFSGLSCLEFVSAAESSLVKQQHEEFVSVFSL